MLIVLHHVDQQTPILVNPDHIATIEPVTEAQATLFKMGAHAVVVFAGGWSRCVTEDTGEITRLIRDARVQYHLILRDAALSTAPGSRRNS